MFQDVKNRKMSSRSVPKPSEDNQISASGRITRVTEKFAYIKSSKHGGIFVPPCAILPKDIQVDPDLRNHLKSGDVVHFTAIPQKGKNDCNFLATKVTISRVTDYSNLATPENLAKNSENFDQFSIENGMLDATAALDSGEQSGLCDQLGVISSVSETFGYIYCEDIAQTIFFPGSSYEQKTGEPNRINAVFAPNDLVMFSAIPQPEMNGCSWIADTVVKLDFGENQADSMVNLSLGEFLPPECWSSLQSSDSIPTAVTGRGTISSLGLNCGLIRSEKLGVDIYFSALAYVGDDLEGACDSLIDILEEGTEVAFTAIPQNNQTADSVWRAIKVFRATKLRNRTAQTSLAVGNQLLLKKRAVSVKSSASQTGLLAESMLLRAVKSSEPVSDLCRREFPALMRFVDKV